MTPRELIRRTSVLFHDAGIPDPDTDASLLLSHLTGRPHLELRLDSNTVLSDAVISDFQEMASRRLKRIPLQYILGEAPFFGRAYFVDPRVLIPRPETELLCVWALQELRPASSPRVLDLCCGSGCIGLTVKSERPDAVVALSDISEGALQVAARNADRLSVSVSFHLSDLFSGLNGMSFDMIICNPPYIPSDDCESLQAEVLQEPPVALDGGMDGCDLYRRIVDHAGSVLVSGGKLLMELGVNESDTVSSLLSAHGFTNIRIQKDYAGIDRMILASMP